MNLLRTSHKWSKQVFVRKINKQKAAMFFTVIKINEGRTWKTNKASHEKLSSLRFLSFCLWKSVGIALLREELVIYKNKYLLTEKRVKGFVFRTISELNTIFVSWDLKCLRRFACIDLLTTISLTVHNLGCIEHTMSNTGVSENLNYKVSYCF